MADPALRLMKMQQTERRTWIGSLDGLLKGFDINRGSSTGQLEVASMQIVEFFFHHRRIGLQSLQNRMNQAKVIQNTLVDEENEAQWKKNGDIYKLLRGTLQMWRKKIKAHQKAHSGNMGKLVWPAPPKQKEDILNDLLDFASLVLEHSAVDEWYSVDPGNATHTDDKFTKGIIDAFWMGKVQHRAWLAEKDAWGCWEKFEAILMLASGSVFKYPDGEDSMDMGNIHAQLDGEEQVDDDGYFGPFNKHIIHKTLYTMEEHQTNSVQKIIKLVTANGLTGVNGEQVLPRKLHKSFQTFLEVCNCLQVDLPF